MKPIQFRWIEAFQAVAHTGSTIEAAESLGIDQSAVSRYVAALEGQLGLRLFDRQGRRLKLSADGKAMLTEAGNTVGALDRFRKKAHALEYLTSGHLDLVTSASLARGLLPKAISAFRQQSPDVTIKMTVATRPELEAAIAAQQFDLCAVALPFAYPEEQLTRLGKFSGVCIMPASHRLAAAEVIDLLSLKDEAFIGLPEATIGRMRIDTLFREAGLQYSPILETTAVAINEMVAAGVGIAISDPFTARSAHLSDVCVKPLRPTIQYEFAFLFPRRGSVSRLAERLVDIAQAELRQDDQSIAS